MRQVTIPHPLTYSPPLFLGSRLGRYPFPVANHPALMTICRPMELASGDVGLTQWYVWSNEDPVCSVGVNPGYVFLQSGIFAVRWEGRIRVVRMYSVLQSMYVTEGN